MATLTDRWIPSACGLCYGTCSIVGHEKNGVLVKIEGNPQSAIGRGRLCGKGVSGIDRKSTRLNSSHIQKSRMPSSA